MVLQRVFTRDPALNREISETARQNREAKLVMQIDSAPDPAATNRFDRDFFHVYVGFNIQYKNEHTRNGSRIILTLSEAVV